MSIILLTDGSPETARAASFAISLARMLKEELIAQVVIDRESVLHLTGFRGFSGLCGSGVFLRAYEEIVSSLSSVSESLLMSLTALAEGCGVKVTSYVDTGDAPTILADLIAQHESVLVVGGTDSNRALLTDHEFDCPTFMIRGQTTGSVEVIMLTSDKRSNLLNSMLSSESPGVPVKRYDRHSVRAA